MTDEYRELAANLKKDLINNQDTKRQPEKSKSKKGGKDMDSRSEDRGSAAPAGKRRKEKDNEIETVRNPHFIAVKSKRKAGLRRKAVPTFPGLTGTPYTGRTTTECAKTNFSNVSRSRSGSLEISLTSAARVCGKAQVTSVQLEK